MTIAKSFFVASLGIGMMLAAGSFGCASSTPAAAAPGAKTAASMDSDDDGIFDDVDLCPSEKEDGKGAAPKDGCPDGKGKA